MGGFNDATIWSVAWAMFAAAAGLGLAAVAIAFAGRIEGSGEADEYGAAYNALAPVIDR